MPNTEASAHEILAGLVGHAVYTITDRRRNEILGLDDGEVIVTSESGKGPDRIPVAQVEMVLKALRANGEVPVNPDAFADRASRSSFVGAVLAQLDDVVALTNPQRLRLRGRTSVSHLLERACNEVRLPRLTDRFSAADPFAVLMTRELRDAVSEHVPMDGSWKVKGSAGQGNWAETPWVSVFDLNVTDTATRGYYVVYLIRADGGGAVLSLNQGTTDVYNQARRRYQAVLEHRAASYVELIADQGLDGLELGRVNLGGGRPPLTPGYEAGNIAAITYHAGAVPVDATVADDLSRMLRLYRALIEARDGIAGGEDTEAGDASFEERRRLRWHLRAEGRNRRAVREAKRLQGYRCCVCGVDFDAKFGDLGRRCIDAHHLTPFGELGERPTSLDPREDFAIVCVNHHRMLHATTPPLAPDVLRAQLQATG